MRGLENLVQCGNGNYIMRSLALKLNDKLKPPPPAKEWEEKREKEIISIRTPKTNHNKFPPFS